MTLINFLVSNYDCKSHYFPQHKITDPCFFLKRKNGLREDFYGERTGLEVIIIRKKFFRRFFLIKKEIFFSFNIK